MKSKKLKEFIDEAVGEIMAAAIERDSKENLSLMILFFHNFKKQYLKKEIEFFESCLVNLLDIKKDAQIYSESATKNYYNDTRKGAHDNNAHFQKSDNAKEKRSRLCGCLDIFSKKP
jgi:hypothetical protein